MAMLFRLASLKSDLESEIQGFSAWLQEKMPDIMNEIPESRGWFKSNPSIPFVTTYKSTNIEGPASSAWSLGDVLHPSDGDGGGGEVAMGNASEDAAQGDTWANAGEKGADNASDDGMDVDHGGDGNGEGGSGGMTEVGDAMDASGVNMQGNGAIRCDDDDEMGNGAMSNVQGCDDGDEMDNGEKRNGEESNGEKGNCEEECDSGDAEGNDVNLHEGSEMDTDERRSGKGDGGGVGNGEKTGSAGKGSGQGVNVGEDGGSEDGGSGDGEEKESGDEVVEDRSLKSRRRPKPRPKIASQVNSRHCRKSQGNANGKADGKAQAETKVRGNTKAGSSKEFAIEVDAFFVSNFFNRLANIFINPSPGY